MQPLTELKKRIHEQLEILVTQADSEEVGTFPFVSTIGRISQCHVVLQMIHELQGELDEASISGEDERRTGSAADGDRQGGIGSSTWVAGTTGED